MDGACRWRLQVVACLEPRRGASATGKRSGAPKGAAPGVRRRGACALLALVRLRRAARDRVGLGPGYQAAGLQSIGVAGHAALVLAVVAGPAFAQVAGGLDVRPDDDAGIVDHVHAGIAIADPGVAVVERPRSEEQTSELQSLMRISYAVFCLKKKNKQI